MKYCDLHCDLLYKLTDFSQWTSTNEKENYQITPDGLIGGVFLQTFAVFAPNEEANMSLFEEKRRIFEEVKNFLSPFGTHAVLSVENGAFLQEDIQSVNLLARAGIKMLTLTWNGGNALGGSHGQEKGLTPFGETVVESLAECGILPDVSHLSDRGFFRVEEIMNSYRKPFVASHSNARSLCNHTRNLTDGQIRKIADAGGAIGVNFYPPFLGENSPAQHIAYIIKIGGEDVVSLGSDFDGIERGYYKNCNQARALLERDLQKAGLTSRQTEKVLFSNALRLLAP